MIINSNQGGCDFDYSLYKKIYPEYAIVSYNNSRSVNGTFLNDNDYYQFTRFINIYEKDRIMNYARKEKVFGYAENKIIEQIILKNSVEPRSNFFEYYD